MNKTKLDLKATTVCHEVISYLYKAWFSSKLEPGMFNRVLTLYNLRDLDGICLLFTADRNKLPAEFVEEYRIPLIGRMINDLNIWSAGKETEKLKFYLCNLHLFLKNKQDLEKMQQLEKEAYSSYQTNRCYLSDNSKDALKVILFFCQEYVAQDWEI